MAHAALESALAAGSCDVGQVRIDAASAGYVLCHRDDLTRADLRVYRDANAAADLARFDDSGKYRPLKTAPNLPHGWLLKLMSLDQVECAIDRFYPGRLAVLGAFIGGRLEQTPLRQTLNRQTGMYRVAANISDNGIDQVVGDVCRSDGGCLRTILWKKNERGDLPSDRLPAQKFDLRQNQVEVIDSFASRAVSFVPIPCQEACSVLIDACRKAVKSSSAT